MIILFCVVNECVVGDCNGTTSFRFIGEKMVFSRV